MSDKAKRYDSVGNMMAYEADELGTDETIELFQHLVDTGLAFQLQGHFGRTATRLIEQGLVNRPV